MEVDYYSIFNESLATKIMPDTINAYIYTPKPEKQEGVASQQSAGPAPETQSASHDILADLSSPINADQSGSIWSE